jgi:hypothetical protein
MSSSKSPLFTLLDVDRHARPPFMLSRRCAGNLLLLSVGRQHLSDKMG